MGESQEFGPARPLPDRQEIHVQRSGGPSACLRPTAFLALEGLRTLQKPRRGAVHLHGEDGVQKETLLLIGVARVGLRLVHGRGGLDPYLPGPHEAVDGRLQVVSAGPDVGSESEVRDGHGRACRV